MLIPYRFFSISSTHYYHNIIYSYIFFYNKYCTQYIFILLVVLSIIGDKLKAVISVQKEGKYYIATDLVTNVADQGLTEEEAISNLKKGLEEHYQILMEMAPKGSKTSFIEIEVERYAKTSGAISH